MEMHCILMKTVLWDVAPCNILETDSYLLCAYGLQVPLKRRPTSTTQNPRSHLPIIVFATYCVLFRVKNLTLKYYLS